MSHTALGAIVIGICAVLSGWAVSAVATNIRRTRSARYSAEIQAKILDRFSSNENLVAFLDGAAGKRFFESLNTGSGDSIHRILNSVQSGIGALLVGLSALVLRLTQEDLVARQALLIFGVPATALGLGLLISALISYRLCRSWGLIGQASGRQ
jgi:hypothetical protein